METSEKHGDRAAGCASSFLYRYTKVGTNRRVVRGEGLKERNDKRDVLWPGAIAGIPVRCSRW